MTRALTRATRRYQATQSAENRQNRHIGSW